MPISLAYKQVVGLTPKGEEYLAKLHTKEDELIGKLSMGRAPKRAPSWWKDLYLLSQLGEPKSVGEVIHVEFPERNWPRRSLMHERLNLKRLEKLYGMDYIEDVRYLPGHFVAPIGKTFVKES